MPGVLPYSIGVRFALSARSWLTRPGCALPREGRVPCSLRCPRFRATYGVNLGWVRVPPLTALRPVQKPAGVVSE